MSARMREEEQAAASSSPSRRTAAEPTVQDIPESVDDFLRNFLRRLGLTRTLSRFEAEWFGSTRSGGSYQPDALCQSLGLRRQQDGVRGDSQRLRAEALEAVTSLARTRRESAFHRLQLRRVSEQKARLVLGRDQLRQHLEETEEALQQLEEKWRADTLMGSQRGARELPEPRLSPEKPRERPARYRPAASWSRKLDHVGSGSEAPGKSSFQQFFSIRAHQGPISGLSLHPSKPVVASTSDDRSWKLWDLPGGRERVAQLLHTGEGHSDWLSGCSFHPDGSKLATTSGDKTVRLWDVSLGRCVLTLTGHSQPTWGSSFHPHGRLLASCSADTTARLWDIDARRCRLTLRRHAAAVNSVAFLPSSDLLLTCSVDKTLILWDARVGVGAATLRGHQHPCSHAACSPAAPAVASCDAGGVIHLWDIRKPASPLAAVDAGPQPANHVAFNPSGKLLAVASGKGSVKLVEAESCRVSSLAGHGGSAQSVTFDHHGEALVCAASDGLIHVWF